jgi:hypothetical protein
MSERQSLFLGPPPAARGDVVTALAVTLAVLAAITEPAPPLAIGIADRPEAAGWRSASPRR